MTATTFPNFFVGIGWMINQFFSDSKSEQDSNCNWNATITATDEQLKEFNLHRHFKNKDRILAHTDYDRRFYQISKTGRGWYSIYANWIKIDGEE